MGARGPLSKSLKLGPNGPDLVAVGPNDVPPETAASKTKVEVPEKPKDLPDEVSVLWDEMVLTLESAGLVAKCDGPALELALRHFLLARKASDKVLDQGVMLWDEKNQRDMKNPASTVMGQHSAAFLEYAKQMGLTFVARARTPVDDGSGADNGNPFS